MHKNETEIVVEEYCMPGLTCNIHRDILRLPGINVVDGCFACWGLDKAVYCRQRRGRVFFAVVVGYFVSSVCFLLFLLFIFQTLWKAFIANVESCLRFLFFMLFIYICLFICQSLYLSTDFSLHPSLYLFVGIYTVCVHVYLSVSLYLHIYFTICLCTYLSVCLSFHLSLILFLSKYFLTRPLSMDVTLPFRSPSPSPPCSPPVRPLIHLHINLITLLFGPVQLFSGRESGDKASSA